MTILVVKDRKIYSDSRVTNLRKLVSDDSIKFVLVKNAQWINGEEILAIGGSGYVKQINLLTDLISHRGYEGFKSFNALSEVHMAISLNKCAVAVMCTNHVYVVRWDDRTNILKYTTFKNHETVCIGSGSHIAEIGDTFLRTDPIGMVCLGMIGYNSCGGFVRIWDSTKKNADVTSKHYRYLKLRVVYGILKNLYLRFKIKFLYWG